MVNKKVFIYALINPLNNKVFYIGATVNLSLRLSQHCCDSAIFTPKTKIIEEIKSHGKKVKIKLLRTTTVKKASYWEKFYYDFYTSVKHKLHQPNGHFNYSQKYSTLN